MLPNVRAGCGKLGLLMTEVLPRGLGRPSAWICFFLLAAWVSLVDPSGQWKMGGHSRHGVEFFKQNLALL